MREREREREIEPQRWVKSINLILLFTDYPSNFVRRRSVLSEKQEKRNDPNTCAAIEDVPSISDHGSTIPKFSRSFERIKRTSDRCRLVSLIFLLSFLLLDTTKLRLFRFGYESNLEKVVAAQMVSS